MLVIIIFVLQLKISVLEVFVLMEDTVHAKRFWSLGGGLERELESREAGKRGGRCKRWWMREGGRRVSIDV